jgi:hypothetical protein
MQQLELFTPTPFFFAMTMTADERLALYKADPVRYFQMRVTRKEVQQQVARAAFCAKVEGAEFERLPRG